MRSVAVLAPIVLLAACATHPDKMTGASVSPLVYHDYDCEQLAMEEKRISRDANVLYTHLKSQADADNAQMGVGLILFWPALFALEGGDGPEAAEYRELKGRHEALEIAAIEKKCGFEVEPLIDEVEEPEEPRSLADEGPGMR